MQNHKLSDDEELRLLLEEAEWLEEVLVGYDREMEFAIHAHTEGIKVGDDVFSDLLSISALKQDISFKLGQISIPIKELEERVQEQERQHQENERNRAVLAVVENCLDWLEVDVKPLPAPTEDGVVHEPDRDRR